MKYSKTKSAVPEKQLFADQDGVLWQRYCKNVDIIEPSKEKVKFSAKDLRYLILSEFEPTQVATACLPIPFWSVPMWPFNPKHAKSAWAYACYYCPVCEQVVTNTQQPWRICIQFIIGRRRDGYYDFSWICRLLCGLCSPRDGNCSIYPNILHAREDLKDVLRPILKDFDDRWSGDVCIVCEHKLKKRITVGIPICNEPDCIKTIPMMNSMLGGGDYAESLVNISPRARTKNMMDYFRKCRLDICTPLRWKVCHRNGCLNQSSSTIVCNMCRRVAYCSKKCEQLAESSHVKGCTSYLSVWDAEKLLFI